ncbi:MAG: hypothetical protein IT476_09150, partial [Rhodanobacteraceae bacterium]|nr:hypothetical protein [Rhodanobacteraceae bacterium]
MLEPLAQVPEIRAWTTEVSAATLTTPVVPPPTRPSPAVTPVMVPESASGSHNTDPSWLMLRILEPLAQ